MHRAPFFRMSALRVISFPLVCRFAWKLSTIGRATVTRTSSCGYARFIDPCDIARSLEFYYLSTALIGTCAIESIYLAAARCAS